MEPCRLRAGDSATRSKLAKIIAQRAVATESIRFRMRCKNPYGPNRTFDIDGVAVPVSMQEDLMRRSTRDFVDYEAIVTDAGGADAIYPGRMHTSLQETDYEDSRLIEIMDKQIAAYGLSDGGR